MVPRHKWYILRRRDIDIYIYIYMYITGTTNHHCMYPQIVSMLIHRMIMLTTTYYVPTTSPSSSATTQLTLGKKRNKTHKNKKYSQEAAGAFRHQHHHALCLWSMATSFAKDQQQEQSKVGAGCSYLKNSKGNGWISLRLFITSQPCRRNRELSSHSIFQIESTSVNRTEKGKNLQQRAWPCNLLHINRITTVPCFFYQVTLPMFSCRYYKNIWLGIVKTRYW